MVRAALFFDGNPVNLRSSYTDQDGKRLLRHAHPVPPKFLQLPIHSSEHSGLVIEPIDALRPTLDLALAPLHRIHLP